MFRWYGAAISTSGWESAPTPSPTFSAALAIPGLTEPQQKNIRLIAADAALASGDFNAAIELLGSYSRTDPKVITRLTDAEGASQRRGVLQSNGNDAGAGAGTVQPTPTASLRARGAVGPEYL